MPKSSPTQSPAPATPAKQPTDEATRLNDIALRKKKNADAQAAFRARRANYIATLEETVTNLESVVIQLQDSCREANNESQELKQENLRLRHEFREREKTWRALWQARKSTQGPDYDDVPPLPPHLASFTPPGLNGHMGSHMSAYGSDSLNYRAGDDLCGPGYGAGHGSGYQAHSTVPYTGSENDATPDGHRVARYSSYSYPIQGSNRDGPWPQTIAPSSSSGGESGAPTSSSASPGYVESPTLTSSEIPYVGRFPVEDQKVPLNNLEAAPYVFPSNRSLSPSTSTPGSSSTSLTSPFQFTFSDNSVNHDRPEFNYRRHSHSAQVTLHGGTADISMTGAAGDAVRYRLGTRRANSSADRPLLPALQAPGETGSPHERGSSDGDSTPYPNARLRPRRSTVPSRSSRSPSPGGVPRSTTLAVIKAQAFGALRRTRTRNKRTPEDTASKIAHEVIESRGLNVGVATGTKRPRLDDDDDVEMRQT